jgi:hypothetical protein
MVTRFVRGCACRSRAKVVAAMILNRISAVLIPESKFGILPLPKGKGTPRPEMGTLHLEKQKNQIR